MPKIPDFSKFDLQGIMNSVKSILNPESPTPNVGEGDPIGTKIVQISTLIKNVAHSHEQSAKDLTQINNLLNELYRDLEDFRKLEVELRQKQQAEQFSKEKAAETQAAASSTPFKETAGRSANTNEPTTAGAAPHKPTSSAAEASSTRETGTSTMPSDIDIQEVKEDLKKDNTSPLNPNEGTSKPSNKD